MKISLKFVSAVACTYFALSASANAEYYIVYPATVSCCTTCTSSCSPCATCRCTTCINGCHKNIYTTKRIYHDSWRDHDNKRSHYSIDAIEPVYVIDSCRTTQYSGSKRSYVSVNYYTFGPRHPHYVSTANDPYDPDMTTADDEVMVDSDMNNQY